MMTPAETLRLTGLSQAGEIRIDRWGIPHIRAGSLDDLFFLQGFNAARDRLFQLDLWRKRGLGLLARDFGPGFLAQDTAARAFLYRGDMAAEYAAYGPDTAMICARFAAGINAFIALCRREPHRMPPEFGELGIAPEDWAPQDVLVIRSHALSKNAVSEVMRAAILARADVATDALRKSIEPPRVPATPVRLEDVPLHAADLFKLASAGVTLTSERLAATLADAPRWSKVTDLGEVLRQTEEQGSNNWAIHGSRTATGRPILASDPHRLHSLPSLRYLVHLTAPGFDAIGAGEPCLPGISLGHNGTAAFGLTIFGGDQEDVFVYETHPDNPDLYRYGAGWEAMRIVEEAIPVKGHADQIVRLRFTRHGPVTSADPAKRTATAIRSVWFEPGANAYAASLATMRARSLPHFQRELRRWGAPSVNMAYADTSGAIAWMPAGYTPRRPNWDGLLPVPGDGTHEWDGFLDPDALPRVVNPASGFVYTANEMNLPADWPHDDLRVGHEWVENSRATRIREALEAIPTHDLPHSCALQTDVLSVPARRLCAVIRGAGIETAASRLLAGWDHRLEADSAAAALFEVWFTKHLKPGLFALLCPDPVTRALLVPGDIAGIVAAVEQPDARFGNDPQAARNQLLAATLNAAFADCQDRMGADVAGWQWGRLHHALFEHALAAITGDPSRNIGPLAKGGSASTPMHTGYRPADFRITNGASVRLVMDVGAWDNSLCLNAPGQSGDPRSPHYGDLAALWASGGYVPMLYSREAVDGATEAIIALEPG